MKRHVLLAAAAAFLSAACASSVQTTSGADYLARYNTAPGAYGTALDGEIREIAAIEPDLRFPARIGLARIEAGRLSTIPEGEGEAWAALAEELDGQYGEFVPVSPLIAAMVAPATDKPRYQYTPSDTIAEIRRGAARQHLDYVLAYEVSSNHRSKGNALAFADLTVIGMFVLPGRSLQAEAAASGILIDVRSGYPYATLTAFADKKGLSRTINAWDVRQELVKDASAKAVLELAGELKTSLGQLAEAAAPAASGFETALRPLCGKAFEGRIVTSDAADEDWRAQRIVMHVRSCEAGALQVPLHVGDNRSRTWLLTQAANGWELRHDHRHEDGSEDALTQYGGYASTPVDALRQEFPADRFTKDLFDRENIPVSKANVWAVEYDPDTHIFAYELRRPQRFLRIEFDTTKPVETPPTPWGWE